jgi:hypothetical protein
MFVPSKDAKGKSNEYHGRNTASQEAWNKRRISNQTYK